MATLPLVDAAGGFRGYDRVEDGGTKPGRLGGFGMFVPSKRRNASVWKWTRACTFLCAGQVICGLAIGVSAAAFLYQFMRTSGVVLGTMMVILGAVGMGGSALGNRPALNLYLVGALFGIMLTFQYVGELGRQVTVDCALAELDIRTINLASTLKRSKDQELFASIYSRMDEMEEMMSMVHSGAIESLAVRAPDDRLKLTDAKYIRKKIDMLHKMAAEIESDPIPYEMIAHVVDADPGSNREGEKDGSKDQKRVIKLEERKKLVRHLSDEDKRFIEKRLKAADEVLDFIDDHQDGDEELTTEYYRELLKMLVGAFDHPKLEEKHEDVLDDLSISVKELPNMSGAIERSKSGKYGQDKLEKYLEEMHELEKLRQEKKEKWNESFRKKMVESSRHRAKLNRGLDDMPQHCLEEEKAMSVISRAGFSLVFFLLVCAFTVLNLLFQIPQKTD